MVADLAMSIDKILAVADATKGDLFLLIFGLDLSIPFIVFTSNVLSRVMDKYPLNLYRCWNFGKGDGRYDNFSLLYTPTTS